MRLIVCMKQVPQSAAVEIDPRTHTLIRERTPQIVNPADANALEAALAIRDHMGGEISVLTMGKPSASSLLHQAAALGADHLYLINDNAFAGSDTYATATILCRAIEYIGGGDLILCGRRAIDGETGQVGPELGTLLSIPCVTNVMDIQCDKQSMVCRRLVEDGEEIIRLPLPALITVCEGINHPRLPSIMGLKKAKGIKINTLSNTRLEIDTAKVGLLGSPTRVIRTHRCQTAKCHGDKETNPVAGAREAADRILRWLGQ